MHTIIRVTTVPKSLGGLLQGQLNFMSQYYKVLGISSKDGDTLHNVGITEGVRVIPVEMTRKITPLKDLRAVYELYKIFKKEKPHIVHSHTPKAGTLSMIAAKLAGVPHRLHTIAGLPLLVAVGKKRKLLDVVEKLTYRCATMIYPNSHGLYDIILNYNFTSKRKLKVIGAGSSNGIDTTHFNPALFSDTDHKKLRVELGIKEGDIVFIFVGRLVKDKGIHELIEAFKKINKTYSATKLVLVGSYEKDLDPISSNTENEINNNNNILMVGWQNDVRPYFSISDILTFPSYREGFPNVVMQAGAMGLPSIVSDINGCNEIISEGKNGLIVPARDEEKLFKAMKEIIETKGLLKQLSLNARVNIIEKYERKTIWKALLKEYRSLFI